jgi:hypothetical protein
MPELFYEADGNWISLPDWSRFLIELGQAMATAGDKDIRLIAGLAIPARAYAACLAAAGVVMKRAQMPVKGFAGEEEHFENICRLEPGTPLVYIKKGRKLRAIFSGIDKIGNETRIRVQIGNTEGGNLTELLNKRMAVSVSVAIDDDIKLPKKQLGYKILNRKAFLDKLLQGVNTNIFALSSRLDCVIVGPAALIRREATDTGIAVKLRKGTFAEGTFHDLLRVRRFLMEGKPYRADVYPVSGSRHPGAGCASPAAVIFDGALAFLKWREYYPGLNWIVLLDRTGNNFWEGAEALNQDYIKNRTSKGPNLDLPPVPAGIEMILYGVARQ